MWKVFEISLLFRYFSLLIFQTFLIAALIISAATSSYAGVYDDIYGEDDGRLRRLSYSDFMRIKTSYESYVLLDVLHEDSFKDGHIDGARSFPTEDITRESASNRLSLSDNIIVYSRSSGCSEARYAAERLRNLGYRVMIYKGGIKEYQEKGHILSK